MDRQYILNEIKRVAAAHGGVPPGQGRFHAETGLKASDWLGRYWARWSDALAEAGFPPNHFNQAYGEKALIEAYISVVRRLGHLPTKAELMMESRAGRAPWVTTFRNQLGTRSEVVSKLRAYCQEHPDYSDVLAILPDDPIKTEPLTESEPEPEPPDVRGYVYLLKSGRFYKLGRTNSVGRREYEVGLTLPLKTTLIHEIMTDDPSGIEAYWHKRFASRRLRGEWFELTSEDVAAFRRRTFM